jgi:hypothetical protein
LLRLALHYRGNCVLKLAKTVQGLRQYRIQRLVAVPTEKGCDLPDYVLARLKDVLEGKGQFREG